MKKMQPEDILPEEEIMVNEEDVIQSGEDLIQSEEEEEKTPFVPSVFDLAFAAAVEHLVSKKNGTIKPPSRKSICAKIGIKSQYYGIRAGTRGVPPKHVDFYASVLVQDYHVRLRFLETNEGPILEEGYTPEGIINLSHEPPGQYGNKKSHIEDDFRKELDYLKQQITDKDKIIKLQGEMILDLQKRSEAPKNN